MALLGDIYFYISAFGFAASCALFGFFLRQYRLAAHAVDDVELEPLDLPKVVPLTPGPAAGAGAVVDAEKPKPSTPPKTEPGPAESGALKSAALAALPSSGPAAPRPKSETTFPGGISPAIVYLQSVKSQLEILEKEVANLKSLASKQSGQEELILKKLGELSEQIKASASRPAPAAQVQMRPPSASAPGAPQTRPPVRSAPAPAPAPPLAPAPAPPAPVPQPVVPAPEAAAPSPAVTLSPLVEPPAAAAPAEPAEPAPIVLDGIPHQGEASAENKPVRRGPVWPI